jgi:outer membrane protein OmpA-like peptidoglycan-associated protein
MSRFVPFASRLKALLLVQGLLGTSAGAVWAQTSIPVGDGIVGEYYDGTNFERFVMRRHDATINFDWGQQPPMPGLAAEQFSVRWTGWLVPPVSGKYIFHVTVDDGIRLWLNDRLLMNEWRGQSISNYTAAVELRAGEPYRLRVDYCQYGLDTRVFVTWELPVSSSAAPPSSWRNLWGMAAETPGPEPISIRYLFSRNPRPAVPSPPPAPKPLPKPPQAATAIRPAAVSAPATKAPVRRPTPALVRRPVPTPPPAPAPVAATAQPRTDSSRVEQLTRLAVGETVTLPELYFEQGQARLLPLTRAVLDRLATVLAARPELRLEVQGHTDNVGNAELNRQLSQQRAEVVCLYLTAHGVGATQLRAKGYGGTQPVADNADPAQRPRNRRVVLQRLP